MLRDLGRLREMQVNQDALHVRVLAFVRMSSFATKSQPAPGDNFWRCQAE
jgi:hypothetical protein